LLITGGIRTIYNQAIEASLVDRKHYPFGKGKIKIKFPESLKIGLNIEDVKAIAIADVTGLPHHARNLWLFLLLLGRDCGFQTYCV